MLKYQVRTLPRKDKARGTILEEGSEGLWSPPSTSSDESTVSPSASPTSIWGNPPSSSRLRRSGAWSGASSGSGNMRMRSASVSSLSSAGSSAETPIEWGTLKVHTGNIRSDTDYKTVFVSTSTTAGEMVRTVLAKFRLGNYKDPKLYFLSMHIRTRREGAEVDTVLGLEEDARPLELQACHPRGRSRFHLNCREGIRVRVHDQCLSPQSNYKSILISGETTCAEGVALVLQLHRLGFPHQNFVLVSVNKESGYEYMLPPEAYLASVVREAEEGTEIHLRPFTHTRFTLLGSTPPSPSSPLISTHRL